MTTEEKAKAYDKALEGIEDYIKSLKNVNDGIWSARNIENSLSEIFPQLKESEDEKLREQVAYAINQLHVCECTKTKLLAWLEKQGEQKPDYCHHEVDLSNCSEEYRKAYYDGWNNCNMQHSQCQSESNDVIKCLINGMKFYYEDNEEAKWGTAKFSMKVKDILSWLEKQVEQNPAWSEEDDYNLQCMIAKVTSDIQKGNVGRNNELIYWLQSLKERYLPQSHWKPTNVQLTALQDVIHCYKVYSSDNGHTANTVDKLYDQLKALK